MSSDQTPWVVKGVPDRIKRVVKSYASAHGLTMAAALEFLVDAVVDNLPARSVHWQKGRAYFTHIGLPVPPDIEVAALLGRAGEIRERQVKGREFDASGLDMEALKAVGLLDPNGADMG